VLSMPKNLVDFLRNGGPCAHIIIFQAPDTDSEMIVKVPRGLGGDITTVKGS
jgi:hypothetical protein